MELFKSATGINLVHVPYRGSAPALTDTVAGHTQLMFATVNVLLGPIEQGQLKVLATTEAKRMSRLPDVLTLAESGVPGVSFTAWYGVVAKSGTPAPVQQKLSQALLEVINEADIRQKLIGAGFEISPDGPQEAQRLLNVDLDKWGAIIKNVGLQPE